MAHGTEPHLAAQNLGYLGLVNLFKRGGQCVMRARINRAVVLAKTQHNALLIWIYNINARQKPDKNGAGHHNKNEPAARHFQVVYFSCRVWPKIAIVEEIALVFRFCAAGFNFIPLFLLGFRSWPVLLALPFFL